MGENAPVSVLADRYASNEMRQVFAPDRKLLQSASYGLQLLVRNQSLDMQSLMQSLKITKRY
jgi:hypothetical protein